MLAFVVPVLLSFVVVVVRIVVRFLRYGAGTRSRGLGRSKGRVWPLDATSPGEVLAATVRGNREQAFL